MSSIIIAGDTSGSVTLQAPSVAGSTTITLPATSGTLLQSGTTVTEAQGGTGTTVGYNGFKNRIINGAIVIDQRNAGASVTPLNAQFTLDRFQSLLTQASKYSVQQNAGSVTPPAGFTKYLGCTSLSAYSLAAGDFFLQGHYIEGYNIVDLGWGTANAKTVTLSFWVRSSLTGTFGGSLYNNSGTVSYPYSYTISSANTWEQKSITIAGPTTGTWESTNSTGVAIQFSLGSGTTYSGTAGAWANAFYTSATGATSVVGTNGATFYITGVQLEKGSTATSFDFRSIGTELALCQRYVIVLGLPTNNQYVHIGTGSMYNSTAVNLSVALPVSMRATPTVSKTVNGSNEWLQVYVSSSGVNSNSTPEIGEYLTVGSNILRMYCPGSYSGGTGGQASWCQVMNGAQLVFNAEL